MAQELIIDVHGHEISIHVRGTGPKTTYGKADAPWLVCVVRADDPDAIFTRDEYRAIARNTANAHARELGWVV